MTNNRIGSKPAKIATPKTLEALIVGHNANLLRVLPSLLARAGFEVDAITTATRFKPIVPARNVTLALDTQDLIAHAVAQIRRDYDLVVVGDDRTLNDIVQSDLPDDVKLRLCRCVALKILPTSEPKLACLKHSPKNGITTPEFWMVSDCDALVALLESTPHPVMVKIDRSSGGAGVFKFEPGNDITALLLKPIVFPVLVQRYIEGDLIDLSGFYQNGNLIHFGHASLNKVVSNPFGVSSVRTYTQLSHVKESVFADLQKMGKALGAHGFVNIACLRSAQTGQYYFVEADMRPTVWVEYPIYMGDDPADAIRDCFKKIKQAHVSATLAQNHPQQLTIPYALRLTAIELMTNRYRVWRYCDGFSKQDLARHCAKGLIHAAKQVMMSFIKPRAAFR